MCPCCQCVERLRRDPVTRCKSLILVFGFTIVCLALFSHLSSAWMKAAEHGDSSSISGFKICFYKKGEIQDIGRRCPDIAFEQFFVAIASTCFLLSVVATFAESNCLGCVKSGIWKYVDLGYHLVSSVSLLIVAILYIISAVEIQDLDDKLQLNDDARSRYVEKLLAGAITLGQSLLYAIVVIHISKRHNYEMLTNEYNENMD